MPTFPTKETNIAALGYRMIFGYVDHLADFPHIDVDEMTMLISTYFSYTALRKVQSQACAAVKLAIEAKNARLGKLKESMKNCLKKSEVDTADNPEKLGLIGWGPKANPQPTEVPGQPTDLRIIAQGRGTILLNFDRPAAGGTVRNYIIERRAHCDSDDFGAWTITAAAYEPACRLTGQPCRIPLEYRVNAINSAGQSVSSNVVSAVL